MYLREEVKLTGDKMVGILHSWTTDAKKLLKGKPEKLHGYVDIADTMKAWAPRCAQHEE